MGVVTLSGNEITDAVRNAGVEGDGIPEEGSTGIWEATTNLVLNGGAETDTTGYTANGSSTLSSSADEAKFGAKSVKSVSTGTDTGWVYNTTIALATSEVYSASVWVRAATGDSSIGQEFRIILREDTVGVTADTTVLHTMSATWTKVDVTHTITDGDNTRLRVFLIDGVSTTAAVGWTHYTDGLQLELQPIATPYVETDGATAARTASAVSAPASVMDETQMWLAASITIPYASDGTYPSATPQLFKFGDDSSNSLTMYLRDSDNTWVVLRQTGGAGAGPALAASFVAGDNVVVIAAFDATDIHVSAEGSAFTTTANTSIPTVADSEFHIGTAQDDTAHGDFTFHWAAVGTGTLTDGNAATINGFGSNGPGFAAFDIGSAVPTWYWGADSAVSSTSASGHSGLLLRGVG